MGRLDVSMLRYCTKEMLRVLAALEQGMRNHELVSTPLVVQLADLRSGGVSKILRDLCSKRLAAYERGMRFDGYRLTNLGYDYLALNTLYNRKVIKSVATQIGIGKESDIYHATDEAGRDLVLKIHRLGRTCFKKLKEKRDYHAGRHMSWIYLSRVSASKEFAYMKALGERGFAVPEAVDTNRHCVVMTLVPGWKLQDIEKQLKDPATLYSDLMQIIVDFANNGVVHGDFNEFNIMINSDDTPVVIDFPQLVSTNHKNAKWYFDRDVDCIRTFFSRRFGYKSELAPDFNTDVKKEFSLDAHIKASGYDQKLAQYYKMMERIEAARADDGAETDDSEADDTADEREGSENTDEAENSYEAKDSDEDDQESDEEEGDIEGNVSEMEEAEDNFFYNEEIEAQISKGLNFTLARFVQSQKAAAKLNNKSDDDSDEDSDNEAVEQETHETGEEMQETEQHTLKQKTKNISPLCAITEDEVSHDFSRCVTLLDAQDDASSVTSRMSAKRRRRTLTDEQKAHRKARHDTIMATYKKQQELKENGEVVFLRDMLEEAAENDDTLSGVSWRSGASSFTAQSLKSFAKSDIMRKEAKAIPRKALRAKGEASAVKRSRKENATNIKQTVECQDVWG